MKLPFLHRSSKVVETERGQELDRLWSEEDQRQAARLDRLQRELSQEMSRRRAWLESPDDLPSVMRGIVKKGVRP